MSDQPFTLEKARSIASILSAVAIPTVLALIGYTVQQSIAEDGIKKDYLTMAMGMLRDGGEKLDPSLKTWATTVVSKYSPVPFTAEAQNKLGDTLIKPYIPHLAAIAKQEKNSSICHPGCSEAILTMQEEWKKNLAGKVGDEALQAVQEILDQSIQNNVELAGELDRARISGNACVEIYDTVRKSYE